IVLSCYSDLWLSLPTDSESPCPAHSNCSQFESNPAYFAPTDLAAKPPSYPLDVHTQVLLLSRAVFLGHHSFDREKFSNNHVVLTNQFVNPNFVILLIHVHSQLA